MESRRKMLNKIFILAWPAFIELTLTQLTSLVDLAMIGKLGPWALSAVGFTTQPKMIVQTVLIAINTGATALVARYVGAREYDKANRVFNQAIVLNIFVGLIISVAGYFGSGAMIRLMGATDELIVREATKYLQIQMVGLIAISLSTTITACLRGIGNSKTAMIYNLVANLVNVVFNYLLIYGKCGFPKLGVSGASLATAIGQIIAATIAIIYIKKKKKIFVFNLRFRIDGYIMKTILAVGTPAMAEQVAMRIGMVIYAIMVAKLGTIENATHQVCMNILGFSFMIGQAFAVSATTMVGQKLGEGEHKAAEKYGIYSTSLAVVVSIFVGIIFLVFNRQIMDIFTDDKSVIEMGSGVIMLLGVVQPMQAVQFTLTGALRGAGDTLFAAVISLITICGVRLVVGYIMMYVLGMGLIGAWFALITDQAIRTSCICVRYMRGKWKKVLRLQEA